MQLFESHYTTHGLQEFNRMWTGADTHASFDSFLQWLAAFYDRVPDPHPPIHTPLT